MTGRITRRGRGRALLARQLLLARADLDVVGALAHLVAMQAQSPQAPYVGLWSRLAAIGPELSRLQVGREVVRATTLCTTVHLSTRTHYPALRATPLSRAALGRALAELIPGQDPQSLGYAATWTEPVVQLPPRGVWRTVRRRGITMLTVEPFRPWRRAESAEVESERRALLAFVAPGEDHRLEMMSA